jgi:hypothetical protein
MKKILTTSAALAALLIATPAHAVPVVSYNFDLFADADQPTPFAFTAGTSGFFEDAEGSVNGVRRSPYESNATGHAVLCATCNYNSVSGGGGSATYNIGATENQTLAMMWGSPDPETNRNRIDFYSAANGTGSLLHTLQGTDVVTWLLANGPAGREAGRGYVTMYFTGLTFASIILSDASSNAFEHVFRGPGQVVTENIPLPAGLLLLLSGLAGLGFMGRARAKTL